MNQRTLSSALIAAAYGLTLVLALIACGTAGSTSYQPASGSGTTSGSGASSNPGTSSYQPAAPQVQGSAMARAYQAALEGIYNDHLYPNGDLADVPEWAEMEKNLFALFDVDGDGEQELLYRNESASMTGMVTNIYGFDESTETLYLELSGFVGMTIYDNGIIRVMASHNHGLSAQDDFWPYTLYQYDMGGDGYLMAGSVDAWNKETFPADFEGSPFPDGVDQDGDGLLYLITYSGQEVAATQLDGPDYEKWLNSYTAGAAELDIPWQAMTLENIQALTATLSFPF